jgi:HAD superfamily hydrolase (TIGR01509 family)
MFDFNGTLSDDEPILCEIYRELFAEYGKPLSAREYFDELAGLSDAEIVHRWLGGGHPTVGEILERRFALYRERVVDGSSVRQAVRRAVEYAAARTRVAVVSGAARAEIDEVLRAAGLADSVEAIVAAEDVAEGKPDPAGYLRALALLDEGLRPHDVIAFEDSEAGVAAAKAAGTRCLAVLGTLEPKRLAQADELVPAIDVPLMRRLLG